MSNSFQERIFTNAANTNIESERRDVLATTSPLTEEAAQMNRAKNLGLPVDASIEEIEDESDKLTRLIKSRTIDYEPKLKKSALRSGYG